MNLIGELVVSKNALPYLAERAESQFGVRELSREIKGQYSIINRIADEMQDAIMQVRMMAVSFVFQRFPRLVRDISRKLGKEVQLVLEGEQTEADKNIIESLADPLIHIVRNSLDHGLETPEVRLAAGKPATGKLTIRAAQEADRVVIEIVDDGKGIDPAVIKQKAYEKGNHRRSGAGTHRRSGGDQSYLRRRPVHCRGGFRPLRPRSGHGCGSLRSGEDQWHSGDSKAKWARAPRSGFRCRFRWP
jgi:chemotaxis protein histidine kinase CheA